jgi:glycosyltransferase involved in cell wall biosynthesis
MNASDSKNRVLFIASQPFFQWRGSPIRIGFDVMALSESGYRVDMLVLPVGDRREIPGVRILRAPNVFGVKRVPIGPSLIKLAFDGVMFFQALGLALRHRYAVIHGVEDAGAVALVVAKLTRTRMVFEKHSDPSSYKKGLLRNLVMWLYSRVEQFTMRHADACIGTGPGLVRQIQNLAPGRPAHSISDIPSSLVEANPESVGRIRKQLTRSADDVLIMYAGSFAIYQGIELLFASIPVVVKNQPAARFVIIGGSADEISHRQAWLQQQGVAGAVVFVGMVPPDELPNYLSASDILLSPRLAGVNTPLKLLDYLKAGGAIVATDTEANRLILDETTAVLTRPETKPFADGILELVANPARRLELATRGRTLNDEAYTYQTFKKNLVACYDGVLGPQENRAYDATFLHQSLPYAFVNSMESVFCMVCV